MLAGEKVRILKKSSIYWHAREYANKLIANGHVEAILSELGVLGKRQKERANIILHDRKAATVKGADLRLADIVV